MATKFRSPRRWDDYQINKALCFVVLAVFSFVIFVGVASASLTSYFTQVNANKNLGYVDGYSDSNFVGIENPTNYVDEVIVDPYHLNDTITTTIKTSDYAKFTYIRFEVVYESYTLDTNYAKLKLPKDGTFCIINTYNSWYPIDSLPTCTLEEALAWSSCDTSNCPSNFDWYSYWQTRYTYFYIYPRQPLDDDINLEFQFFGSFTRIYSESSVNFALFTSYLFVALALVIPFVLLVAAIVAKKLRKPFPVDEPDDDHDHENNIDKNVNSYNNVDGDEFSGEELSTFSRSRIN